MKNGQLKEQLCYYRKPDNHIMNTIYGNYSTKIYELNYLSFEMSARYALRRSFNINRVKSHFVGGAYISHLNKAFKTIDYSVFDISTDFDPIDYGVILGYELEIKIIEHFAITPGIRY